MRCVNKHDNKFDKVEISRTNYYYKQHYIRLEFRKNQEILDYQIEASKNKCLHTVLYFQYVTYRY